MAGLRKGYMFDDWHGTKKYYPSAYQEVQQGLLDKEILDQLFEDENYIDPEEMEHWIIDAFLTGEIPVFAARFWGLID